MHVTATAALIVALVGVGVGLVGLGLAWWAWIKVRRVREAQRSLIGGGRKDLVDFAVSLQGRIDDLHRAVDEVAAGLARVDRRIDGTVTNTSIVRYDAYEDTGGHQSASLALLDSARTGLDRHGDPGPRLRPDLHEGARPRPRLGRALARGAGGRRARDGPLSAPARGEPSAGRRSLGYIPRKVQQVLVLNASYEPLNVCSLRRAHVLVFKGKAEVVEELDRPLRSATRHVPVAARHPARPLRPRPAHRPAQDLAPGALRP